MTSLATAAAVRAVDADQYAELAREGGRRNGARHWLDDVSEPIPATSIDFEAPKLPLPRAPSRAPAAAIALSALLSRRRSVVLPGATTRELLVATLDALGSSRAIELDDAGRIWQSRAHPSAGGTHSLEPLVHAVDVTGLRPGWYRQEGERLGRIGPVSLDAADGLDKALNTTLRDKPMPAAVVYAVADLNIIQARYPTGSSLLWRDAGAFLMTAHLIATAFGYSSTIVGLTWPLEPLAGHRSGSAGTARPNQAPAYVVGAVAVGGALEHGSDVAERHFDAVEPATICDEAQSVEDLTT